jgi:hypothetical protein
LDDETTSSSNLVAPEPVPEPEAPLGEAEITPTAPNLDPPTTGFFDSFPPVAVVLDDSEEEESLGLLAADFNSYNDLDNIASIPQKVGEILFNLLQQVGMRAPNNWTMPELAAEVIDVEGSIPDALHVLEDLLFYQTQSFYFEHTVEFVRLIMS